MGARRITVRLARHTCGTLLAERLEDPLVV